jgi:hypothetical protein
MQEKDLVLIYNLKAYKRIFISICISVSVYSIYQGYKGDFESGVGLYPYWLVKYSH